jgi:hypothetical protein
MCHSKAVSTKWWNKYKGMGKLKVSLWGFGTEAAIFELTWLKVNVSMQAISHQVVKNI